MPKQAGFIKHLTAQSMYAADQWTQNESYAHRIKTSSCSENTLQPSVRPSVVTFM